MSIVTWPTGLSVPAGFTLGQVRYDMTESSDSTGADAARLLGPPRWTASLRSVEAMTLAEAGLWEAMLLQLRGRVNHLALHDPVRAAPAGTLRGSPALNNSTAAGATSMTLANVRNATNLLLYSRAFSNPFWTASNVTVTDNTYAAPDGTTSADTLTDASAVATGYLAGSYASPAAAGTYTGSIYVRKTSGGTAPTFRIEVAFSGGTPIGTSARINTDTGAVLSGTGVVTSIAADWWRVQVSATNNGSGNTSVSFNIRPAVDVYGGSGTDPAATGSAVIWGAQLEEAGSASAYERATIRAGDWLQIGSGVGTSQLVKVTADAEEANGNTLAVSFEPPLRDTMAGLTAITWDKPVAYYKQTSSPQWGYRPAMRHKSTGYALDLLESWTS